MRRSHHHNRPPIQTDDIPTPLDVQQLVESFTEAAEKLIARLDSDAVTQQQIATAIRQSVADGLRSRKLHQAQIIEIDRLVIRETRNSKIRERLPGWLARAGLRRVEELNQETKDWFFILNADEDGDCVRVVQPAYVDASTGTLVQSGQLRRADHDPHGKKSKCVLLAELMAGSEEASEEK